MTWGCPSYLSGHGLSTCGECEHCARCKELVGAGIGVICETPDDELDLLRVHNMDAQQRNYRDVLTYGVEFTASQLAEWTGRPLHLCRNWCSDNAKGGELAIVGKAHRAGRGGSQANVYCYVGCFAASLDAATGGHIIGTPEPSVAAPIEVTT